MLNSSERSLNSNLLNEVQISVQKESGTKRQITVQIAIPYPIEQVWQLITNYDKLAEFIPNLIHCHQINQTETSKQVEFIGQCQILHVQLSIRLILNVIESHPYSIKTQMIEGDLRSYQAHWHLAQNQDGTTVLSYQAEIIPKLGMPIALLERQIQQLLPINFLAIRQQLDHSHSSKLLVAKSHDHF